MDRIKRFMGKDAKIGYSFLAPALILFALLNIYPTIYSFILSFHKWNGLDPHMDFVGISNYLEIFKDKIFHKALLNTAFFSVFTVVVQSFLALLLAVFIENVRQKKLRAFFRITYYFPAIISPVVVALIWGWMFHPYNGALNNILNTTFFWLSDKRTVMPAILIANLWQWTGYNALIFSAGLQSVPKEIYEAADIDGANAWNKFWHVTIPSLKPVASVVIVTTLINGIKVFGLVQVMTAGGPNHLSEVMTTWLYKNAFGLGRLGYASAMGYVMTFISFILTFIYLKQVNKND